ncbi:S-adenosyl-L-methionine-dependent methyltransferase [Lepidopterella palustris CBS 459.81]|uniref:S-adenosyl-L-methionine-dependent methyltransferase n=1 Tax=Lepidopterella palustris CBS 459.81 TaxID=1314670 RepID=A0A8E2E5R3_9PEZI|nr:S-adenosyl-L-methionine-dependent methyltransferase [Lepidopterella palustris CBS 459.81]
MASAVSAQATAPALPGLLNEDDLNNIQIEADEPASSQSDSTFGDDVESYTTSLKSSITNYRYENGRRYHAYKDGSYFLPNDEDESDRLDLFHHIMSLRCGGELHLAPIGDNPQRILDVGTGTGIWAIDMGDKYPSAEVLGNDLSPIQPSLVPPNVKFEVDDIENEWIYGSKFDYIHCRYLAGALKDWPRLMQQAYKFTKPGGWVEFQDFDMIFYTANGEFTRGCALDRWTRGVIEGIQKFGLEPEPGPKLEGWVKDAGFENVHHRLLPIPVGQWPKDKKLKEIGALDLVQFLDGLEGITLRVFTIARGWSAEEIQVFLADVRKDLKNPRLQAQHNFHVVYAQKPLNSA